jgi:hypothetical protein
MGEEIKKELVGKGCKLWKPPYYGVRRHEEALRELASTFERPDDALPHLRDLQRHALEKLRNKGRLLEELHIKILGTTVPSCSNFPEKWAQSVESSPNSIRLVRPNPDLTLAELSKDLQSSVLDVTAGIRLIHKGRALQRGATHLNELAAGAGASKTSVLCLVQTTTEPQTTPSPDDELVASIRTAASKLQSRSVLDITDSSGNLVSMSHGDRLAFLTALGLHAIGRQRMRENRLESALVLLLQADQEWGRLNESWRVRVDNYGLLQLDVCWIYLKFESMENLPDVTERLERAESALRKQVHANFVTLALVQADMNNPVPALSAVFVRLFLLQGVAQHYQLNTAKSKERLDWAWALAKSLRAVSPPDAVARLCEAVEVTPHQAISALRRTNGNVDQAAEMIQKEEADAERATEDRYKQRKYGLCENGTDYVNLQRLDQLKPLLGLPPGDDERVASGLLRLANNNLDRALDRYQTCSRDESTVLQQVADLDQSQGVPRKRSRVDVDEIALASLESMGVDDATARRALQENSNNVEMALLWLTNQNSSMPANSEGNAVVQATTVSVNQEDAISVSSRDSSTNQGQVATTPASASIRAANVVTPQGDAEREAINVLKQVLGEVLEEQHKGDEEFLGSSLDEEWGYIEEFRG